MSESIHEFKISQEDISSTVDTILEVSNIEQNISSETEQSETNSNAEQNTSADTKYTEAADQSQASSDYSQTTEQPSEGSVEPPTVDTDAENQLKQKQAQDKHEQEKLADTVTQLINRNNETKREIREQEKQLKQFQGNQAILTDTHLLLDEPKTLEGLQQQEQELAKALKTQELKVKKIKLDRLQKQQEAQEEIDALLLNNSTLKQQIRHINLQLRALDGPTAEQANENLLTLQPDTKDELVDQAAELTTVIKQFQAKLDKLQQDKDDQQQQQLIDDAQKEQDRLQAEQIRLQQEQEARDKAKQEHDQLLANVDKATAALQAAQLDKQKAELQAKQAAQNAADAKLIQDQFDLETLQAEQAIQDAQAQRDNLLAQQQNYTTHQTTPQQNPVQPPTQQNPNVTQAPSSTTTGIPTSSSTTGTFPPSFTKASTAPLSGAFVSHQQATSGTHPSSSQTAKTKRANTDDMANSLIPGKFAGMVTERADLWIADLEAWLTFKGVDEKNKVDSVPLLLKGSARIWFDAIDKKDKGFFPKVQGAVHRKVQER